MLTELCAGAMLQRLQDTLHNSIKIAALAVSGYCPAPKTPGLGGGGAFRMPSMVMSLLLLDAYAPARLPRVPVKPPALSVVLLVLKRTGVKPAISGAGGPGGTDQFPGM